jgi:hypothetical protein
MSTPKSSMSVGVIRIGAKSSSEFDQRSFLVCIARGRTFHSEVIPSHRHDIARSFYFCEPKFEVEIVGPTHLSRDKKIPEKIPAKNVTDPSDDESCQARIGPLFDADGRLLI